MIPNLSWGLLDYEADFVVLSKSGYLADLVALNVRNIIYTQRAKEKRKAI